MHRDESPRADRVSLRMSRRSLLRSGVASVAGGGVLALTRNGRSEMVSPSTTGLPYRGRRGPRTSRTSATTPSCSTVAARRIPGRCQRGPASASGCASSTAAPRRISGSGSTGICSRSPTQRPRRRASHRGSPPDGDGRDLRRRGPTVRQRKLHAPRGGAGRVGPGDRRPAHARRDSEAESREAGVRRPGSRVHRPPRGGADDAAGGAGAALHAGAAGRHEGLRLDHQRAGVPQDRPAADPSGRPRADRDGEPDDDVAPDATCTGISSGCSRGRASALRSSTP